VPYELEFTDLFVSQFEKLGKEHQKRIYKKIQELKEDPYRHKALTGPFKALTGPFKGCFRLRVGNYRIVYMPLKDTGKIILIDVDLRKKVYKKDISKIIHQISERTSSRR